MENIEEVVKTDSNLIGKEADAYKLEVNVDPDIVLKDAVSHRIEDYWADTVIRELSDRFGFQWFQIRKDGNKIIIEPVKIEAIN